MGMTCIHVCIIIHVHVHTGQNEYSNPFIDLLINFSLVCTLLNDLTVKCERY